MEEKSLRSEFTFQIEPKHFEKHNYLIYCNNVLVSILKYTDQEKLTSIKLEFKNDEDAR